jgi:ketosteroid isomerase-like protein
MMTRQSLVEIPRDGMPAVVRVLWRGCMAMMVVVVLTMTSAMLAQQRGNAEQRVTDGVRQLVAAYGTNDVEKYFTIYAKDMSILRATGRWTYREYYERWKQVVGGGGGNLSADVVDLKVQMLPGGESAVATFQMPVKSRFPNEEAARGRSPQIIYYMTTVWAHRNNNWNIVHVHWSVEPPPQASTGGQ